MNSVNIYPVLATWKANKNSGLCPVYLEIDLDNKKVCYISLKKTIKADQWDNTKKKVKNNHPNHGMYNALIDKKKRDLDGEFTRLELMEVRLTQDRVKKVAKGIKTGNDYIKFCKEQIEAKNYSSNTKINYLSELTKIQAFRPVILFSDITHSFLQAYEEYMRKKLKNTPNTVWKTLKFHNTMLTDAVKIGGFISNNPIKDYGRGRYVQGIPDYLEWKEVMQFKKALDSESLTESQRNVGYRFFLSCVSGLRFGDTLRFTYKDFVIKDKQGERLLLYAQKNTEIVSIAFTEDISFAVKYLKTSDPLAITNQAFNRTLQVIGGIALIGKSLNSHMGRHSFGMRCAELGMTMDDAQKLLGHRDRKSTEIYFRIKNTRLDSAMKAFDKKSR